MGMFSARPVASLSAGLLARKGQARPAMRSQGLVSLAEAAPLDDLGWNDMGGGASAPAPAVPAVLAERAALRREVERAPLPEAASDAPVAEASIPRAPAPDLPAEARGPRAAFTLRLDAHRHLRLRLASASTNRSAQQLVIQALDALIAGLPEVERLAAQLPPPGGAPS